MVRQATTTVVVDEENEISYFPIERFKVQIVLMNNTFT